MGSLTPRGKIVAAGDCFSEGGSRQAILRKEEYVGEGQNDEKPSAVCRMKGFQRRGIGMGKGLAAGMEELGTCGELNGHRCGEE